MALTDVESSPILSGEEGITTFPSQRRRRNVQLVLLYAVGFVAAVMGVYAGAPMKMIRAATWASTVKLWSNSGTITNSGDGNLMGYINSDQQGDVSTCQGSGNGGSGAGALGTVCCASLKGEVSCDHASSGDDVIMAMSKLKNSDKVKKSDNLRKTFDEKCEHTMNDLISDQKKLDLALMVVCKAHAAEPTLLAELTPGCEWIPQDTCMNDDLYACRCRRENPAGPCTECESAGGSRPKAFGR